MNPHFAKQVRPCQAGNPSMIQLGRQAGIPIVIPDHVTTESGQVLTQAARLVY